MPRSLYYVSGVRLVVDCYDHRLWHCTIQRRRYDVRERRGAYLLLAEDGAKLGVFYDWGDAVCAARDHAHCTSTAPMAVIPHRHVGR